jgi:hypothetical protein
MNENTVFSISMLNNKMTIATPAFDQVIAPRVVKKKKKQFEWCYLGLATQDSTVTT